MIALTSTQRTRQGYQSLTGSIDFFTITLKNKATDDHLRWPGTVAAGGTLKKGVKYTITDIGSGGTAAQADWSDVGHFDATVTVPGSNPTAYYHKIEVGQVFVADDGMDANAAGTDITLPAGLTGAEVSYGSKEAAVEFVVEKLATRCTVVAIGSVTPPTGGATSASFRVVVENSGHTTAELLRELNIHVGQDPDLSATSTDTTDFEVAKYEF